MLEKDYSAALGYFDRAQAIHPNWSVPYFDRASALLDQKEFQAALVELDKAALLPPSFPLFYVLRSLNHFVLGNLEASHADQDSAMRLSPSDALVMTELNLQIYEGYLNWAVDYYGRILTRDPSHALALQGCADACRANLEYVRAVEFYTRALAVNPREALLHFGRGKCHLALNNLEQAQADFQQVVQLTDKLHLKRQSEELLKTRP